MTKIEGKELEYIQTALQDSDPDIRVVGIRAARQSQSDNLVDILNIAVSDPDPQVRREVAIALRNVENEN